MFLFFLFAFVDVADVVAVVIFIAECAVVTFVAFVTVVVDLQTKLKGGYVSYYFFSFLHCQLPRSLILTQKIVSMKLLNHCLNQGLVSFFLQKSYPISEIPYLTQISALKRPNQASTTLL